MRYSAGSEAPPWADLATEIEDLAAGWLGTAASRDQEVAAVVAAIVAAIVAAATAA